MVLSLCRPLPVMECSAFISDHYYTMTRVSERLLSSPVGGSANFFPEASPIETVRNFFPETWIWDLVDVGSVFLKKKKRFHANLVVRGGYCLAFCFMDALIYQLHIGVK